MQTVALIRSGGIHCNDPEIIASNGWTTQNLQNAMRDATLVQSYDLVTLLIGVNNQYQGGSADNYREDFSSLLKQCIQLAGNRPSHVIVISIPDYSVTPFAKSLNRSLISTQIDAFNQINHAISVSYLTRYLNVTDESRKALGNASLTAADGLHFSGKEYGIWAALLLPLMERAISR
jgi:lysophospholipase L1-like esterase